MEVSENAPETGVSGENWVPGDAPTQAARWYVEGIAKAGTIGIIGVFPPTMAHFPIGQAMNKNLRIGMGNCPHRRYIPELIALTRTGAVDPFAVLTQSEPITDAVTAYESFDRREPGWTKVALEAG